MDRQPEDQSALREVDQVPHTAAAEAAVAAAVAAVALAGDERIAAALAAVVAGSQATWPARACLRLVAEEVAGWLAYSRGERVSVCLGAGGAAGCTAAVCEVCCSQ